MRIKFSPNFGILSQPQVFHQSSAAKPTNCTCSLRMDELNIEIPFESNFMKTLTVSIINGNVRHDGKLKWWRKSSSFSSRSKDKVWFFSKQKMKFVSHPTSSNCFMIPSHVLTSTTNIIFRNFKVAKGLFINDVTWCKLTHISEGAFPELEIKSESVWAIRDFRRLSGTFEATLRAVVDGVGEAVGPVDRAIGWTHRGLAHKSFSSWKKCKVSVNSLHLKLTSNSSFVSFVLFFLHQIKKNCKFHQLQKRQRKR